MPIYTVTFCVMDEDTGSSAFWHTCLLLSRLDDAAKKMEVIETWGFYGLPPLKQSPLLKAMRLDLDIKGNHGMLRHEEMRYLDLGTGLHGATFELTLEKFNELRNKCHKIADEQIAAIKESSAELKLTDESKQGFRIYKEERFSRSIYKIELAKAKAERRPPRLKYFELSPFKNANNCKIQALTLLEGIITPTQHARLTGAHRAISRTSGTMERIYLHSSGPMKCHVKKLGELAYYRDINDEEVKLHWTIPPQNIETLTSKTRDLLKISPSHCDEMKKIVRQLQRIEWLFINTVFPAHYSLHREKLITLIREHYENFAVIDQTKSAPSASFVMRLFFPFDYEILLDKNLVRAKSLLNSLFMAIADDWDIEPTESKEVKEIDVTAEEEIDLEALASHLPIDKQKKLCSILGRSFTKPQSPLLSNSRTS